MDSTSIERVELEAGKGKAVSAKLAPEDRMLLDPDIHWTVFRTFDIMIGKSSSDIRLVRALKMFETDPIIGRDPIADCKKEGCVIFLQTVHGPAGCSE